MSIKSILVMAFILCGMSGLSAASDCTGNACDDVYFGYEARCFTTENLGKRTIRVIRGPYSFELGQGQKERLELDGKCVESYFGTNQAWYTSGTGTGNGQQCSDGQISPWIKDRATLSALDSQCASGYCYPGPTAGNRRETAWYCVRADLNCAWPGSEGERYRVTRNIAGASVECRNPGSGNRARFSD